MAGPQGTPTSASPSVFSLPQYSTAETTSPAVQPAMGGGKGAGNMQPQKTAMGTPIVYGNVYSQQPTPTVNPPTITPTPVNPPSYEIRDGFADGTMSVPGYAYGTTGIDDDPWAWTKMQPMSAPMSADIKPSNEQALGRVPDKLEQQLSSMAMGRGVDAATKGIDTAYKAYGASAPLAAMPVAEAAAADLALGGLGGTAGASALTAGAGASGAAALGGEAALAALGPVGMAIGAGLALKKMGVF